MHPLAGQHTLACINALLNTDAELPEIVTLTPKDFSSRFGPQYDGYYVGYEQRIYLKTGASGRLLAHEMAHHARVDAGGWINEPEADRAALHCQGGTQAAVSRS